MTNLALLELAAIAVALDEEGAERKREGGLYTQRGPRKKSKDNLSLFTKN
jgi:hypothetical protein